MPCGHKLWHDRSGRKQGFSRKSRTQTACQPLRTFGHDSSRKKPTNLSGGLPQAGIQRTFGKSGTLCGRPSPPSEGPHRPARATLRRVSFLFCAANAFFSSLHRPQNLVFFGKLSRPCLIETSSSASATPCPCPTSSGAIIAWSHKAGNTSAFVHSTTTPSPHLGSTNGMENGGTSASPAAPVETASRT